MSHPTCKTVILSLLLFPLLVSLTACVTIPPASYSYDQQVDRMFEPPPTLLKDHTYYYIGTSVEPDAIIAIDNRFRMQSKVWSKVEITQEILAKWAFWLDTYLGWWNCPYRGVRLLAPDGTEVGAGYSRWTFSVVKSPEPGVIIVYPPRALGSCRRQAEQDDR
jgi:hypothetical protein